MEHGSTAYYIYLSERDYEYWHAPRQENCGVTMIEIEDGARHVLKESEIFTIKMDNDI